MDTITPHSIADERFSIKHTQHFHWYRNRCSVVCMLEGNRQIIS